MSHKNCIKIYADARDRFQDKVNDLQIEISRDLVKEYAEELYLSESDISKILFDEEQITIFLNDLDVVIRICSMYVIILFDEEVKYSDDKQITLYESSGPLFKINKKYVDLEIFMSKLSQKQKDWVIKRMHLLDNCDEQ